MDVLARRQGATADTAHEAATLLPAPAPLEMPTQRLDRYVADLPREGEGGRATAARLLVTLSTTALAALLTYEMWRVLEVGRVTALEWLMLALFALNIGWICLSFVSAVIGFAAGFGRTANGLRDETANGAAAHRTVLLLPTYNEEPQQIFAAAQAMLESLEETGGGDRFDLVVLSDTTDPAVWQAELDAAHRLRREPGFGERTFYRHRLRNEARKAGNIADFCRRFGGAYAHMIVLDADSLMDGTVLLELDRRMAADPRLGILQTVPRLIDGRTLLGRMQAFATWLYGPVLATGLAFWYRDTSNYWGHNAIIRMAAFAGQAGLPELSGRPPMGGHVLSHDFVEAALVRRGGYAVRLATDLLPAGGSYEGAPPDLPSMAARDRRWCQGNLQHLRLIGARGLHPLSRFHLLHGVMSYVAAPLWLAFLVTGLLLALQAYLIPPDYFPEGVYSLFPIWPRIDAERAAALFGVSLAVLLAPKLFGLVRALIDGGVRRAGGVLRTVSAFLVEVLVSAIMAPISMLLQTRAVIEVLAGRDTGWRTQRRADGGLRFGTLLRFHRWHVIIGLVMAAVAWRIAPALLWWMSPALIGLILAVPLSALLGSARVGRALTRAGLMATPDDHDPAPVIRRARELRAALTTRAPHAGDPIGRLLADPELLTRHLGELDPVTARRPGEIDLHLATARLKIADAADPDQAIAALTPEETRAVMACRRTLLALAGENRTATLPPRRIALIDQH